jgi:hypothetical protein
VTLLQLKRQGQDYQDFNERVVDMLEQEEGGIGNGDRGLHYEGRYNVEEQISQRYGAVVREVRKERYAKIVRENKRRRV